MPSEIPARVAAFTGSQLVTKRAGYPMPDVEWYRNRHAQTKVHDPMTFTKERFITGFNISVGEYYMVRDKLVELLRKDDIYKKKFNNADITYDYLSPIYSKLKKHTLLAYNCHVGWRHHMLFQRITGTAQWMIRLDKKGLIPRDFPYLPDENWRWGDVGLSPKKQQPYVWYKHLNIRIISEEEEVVIMRVVDLTDKELQPEMGDMKGDLDIEKVKFSRLVQTLRDSNFFGYDDKSSIIFTHTYTGNGDITIGSDRQLAYALNLLRVRRSSKVELRVV